MKKCIIYYTNIAQRFECNTTQLLPEGRSPEAPRVITGRIARKNVQYLFYLTIHACYLMNNRKYHLPAYLNR